MIIREYQLDSGCQEQVLDMPAYASIMNLDRTSEGRMRMSVMLDEKERARELRTFKCFTSGANLKCADGFDLCYVGSVNLLPTLWHVFEVQEIDPDPRPASERLQEKIREEFHSGRKSWEESREALKQNSEPTPETTPLVAETSAPVSETTPPVVEEKAPVSETTPPVSETPAPVAETPAVEPPKPTPAPEPTPTPEPAPTTRKPRTPKSETTQNPFT